MSSGPRRRRRSITPVTAAGIGNSLPFGAQLTATRRATQSLSCRASTCTCRSTRDRRSRSGAGSDGTSGPAWCRARRADSRRGQRPCQSSRGRRVENWSASTFGHSSRIDGAVDSAAAFSRDERPNFASAVSGIGRPWCAGRRFGLGASGRASLLPASSQSRRLVAVKRGPGAVEEQPGCCPHRRRCLGTSPNASRWTARAAWGTPSSSNLSSPTKSLAARPAPLTAGQGRSGSTRR